jgi:hypothetical protein
VRGIQGGIEFLLGNESVHGHEIGQTRAFQARANGFRVFKLAENIEVKRIPIGELRQRLEDLIKSAIATDIPEKYEAVGCSPPHRRRVGLSRWASPRRSRVRQRGIDQGTLVIPPQTLEGRQRMNYDPQRVFRGKWG